MYRVFLLLTLVPTLFLLAGCATAERAGDAADGVDRSVAEATCGSGDYYEKIDGYRVEDCFTDEQVDLFRECVAEYDGQGTVAVMNAREECPDRAKG